MSIGVGLALFGWVPLAASPAPLASSGLSSAASCLPILNPCTVSFVETGLSPSTSWSVTFANSTGSSSSPWINFTVTSDGTYGFAVGAVPGYLAGPEQGSVTVSGSNVVENITYTALYSVDFEETGLPTGTNWSITLNGNVQSSTGTTISFLRSSGSYPFSVSDVSGYRQLPAAGSVTVQGANVTVGVAYEKWYSVEFTESGLPASTAWSVDLNGATNSSSSSTIGFSEVNGTYPFSVTAVPGFSDHPATGSVTVAGAPFPVAISFSRGYTVEFEESGLPDGTSWSVTLAGVAHSVVGTTISFSEPNGTYPYQIALVPGYVTQNRSGDVTVAGAPPAPVPIVWSPSRYAVTFRESGLPNGTGWTAILNGSSLPSTGPTISFSVPNGTYVFEVLPSGPYWPSPLRGSVTVQGDSPVVSVVFHAASYRVTFVESGLPNGTSWGVTLGVVANNSVTLEVSFAVVNGTYPYQVLPLPGWGTSTPGGSVIVNGSDPAPITIDWTRSIYAVTFGSPGLSTGTNWSVSLAGANYSTTTARLVVMMPNGSYPYQAGPVPGYSLTDGSGSLTVAGAPVWVNFTWTTSVYAVEFRAEGLPSGTTWEVSLGGTTYSTVNSSLVIELANGSYPYQVFPVDVGLATYEPGAHSGTVHVQGSSNVTIVQFNLPAGGATVSSGSADFWVVPGALATAFVVFLILAVLVGPLNREHRRGRNSLLPPPSESGPARSATPEIPRGAIDPTPPEVEPPEVPLTPQNRRSLLHTAGELRAQLADRSDPDAVPIGPELLWAEDLIVSNRLTEAFALLDRVARKLTGKPLEPLPGPSRPPGQSES